LETISDEAQARGLEVEEDTLFAELVSRAW